MTDDLNTDEHFKLQFDTSSDLDNNFRHLSSLPNVVWSNDHVQRIRINHPDGFRIDIVIPDGIFEWFINVYDKDDLEIISDWDDHYEGNKAQRAKERQEAVEFFVNEVANHKARFIKEKKRFSIVSSFQLFKDNQWTDLIRTSKLKLW